MYKGLDDFYFDKDSIYDLVHNFDPGTFNGGNHNRTLIITQLSSELGISEFQIAPYARVIELVHNATLIHDDVIDESFTRREFPTLNSKITNKKCILIGDYMLAKAMSELASFGSNEIVFELSRTLKDLVHGEILQSFENDKVHWSQENYNEVAFAKTASMLRWCLLTPFMIKDHQLKNKSIIENAANKLGLVYQMIDDVKDFSTLSKKTPFLDISNWNINVVLIKLQYKDTTICDMLRTKRDLTLITNEQRTVIYHCVKDVLFEIDQLVDDISNSFENELSLPQFSGFIKSFFNLELLKLQRSLVDYDISLASKELC